MAIEDLLTKGAIRKCNFTPGQFLSSYFLVPKSDGSMRFILNLKKLNSFIDTEHFKLEDVRTASKLITKGCFMIVLDLKDAYFTIPIHKEHRKFLRFCFNNQLFEFLVLPFGLNTAPFIFTKIMKPILSILRFSSVLYLYDFLLIGESIEICLNNLKTTESLLLSLGFFINEKKNSKLPSQCIDYLRFH